jgi:hypothetical protein
VASSWEYLAEDFEGRGERGALEPLLFDAADAALFHEIEALVSLLTEPAHAVM